VTHTIFSSKSIAVSFFENTVWTIPPNIPKINEPPPSIYQLSPMNEKIWVFSHLIHKK
jgi:hypothetical protein